MIKVMLIIMSLINFIGCALISGKNIQTNQLDLNVTDNEYGQYFKEFNEQPNYKNLIEVYYKGSYSEGQSSSFEATVPSERITLDDAKRFGTYFKAFYSYGQLVKGIGITDNVIDTIFFYDKQGRIIKKYYSNDTFYLKKYFGENSLEEVYCIKEGKYCIKTYLTREEDEKRYLDCSFPTVLGGERVK